MKKYLILFVLCFIFPFTVFAHQPNYVEKQAQIIDNEPEISKAYYGELAGSSAVYKIYASSSLKLYVQILSPDIQNPHKDFSVLIKDDNDNVIANLSTSSDKWQKWYEEYAGDWYWQGPSFNKIVSPGEYSIVVSNQENFGKYSLAIGDIESFPVSKFSNFIKQLYLIKTNFFNEPWYGIFYGIIGKYLLAGVIAILFIALCLFYLYKQKNSCIVL